MIGGALVDRIEIETTCATAVHIITVDGAHTIRGSVIVCAGAYASPGVLIRSGIGAADELNTLGIKPVCKFARRRKKSSGSSDTVFEIQRHTGIDCGHE